LSRELLVEKSWDFPAVPGAVWPLVSDTNRLTRLMDISPVTFTVVQNPDPDRLLGITGEVGGTHVEYDESPFEWVENRYLAYQRTYRKGWVNRLRVHVALEPVEGVTRVTLRAWITPWRGLRQVFGKTFAKGLLSAHDRGYTRLIEGLRRSPADPHAGARSGEPAPGANPVAISAMRLAFAEEPAARGIIDTLADRISHGYDFEVARLAPFELADRWGLDRREVLRVMLRAAHRGHLQLRWEHLCGSCRGPADEVSNLQAVKVSAFCPRCAIDTPAEFARTIALHFVPDIRLRSVDPVYYCVGGPGGRPHLVSQFLMTPGQAREVTLSLPPGDYRLHAGPIAVSAFGGRAVDIRVRESHTSDRARIALSSADSGGLVLELAAGTQSLSLESDAGGLVQIERLAWVDTDVTGAMLATFQEFRNLFPDEALAEGVELRIDPVTILFTDLKSSTALYEQLGDDEAFARVRDHFRILVEAIDLNRGAVVKTVGDAVMAAFESSVDAVRAALDLQAGIERYNRSRPGKEPLVVKPGVHAGPALAVRLNGRLDYFGTTVNLAARVQNEARGLDLVLSEAVVADPAVGELLASMSGHRREVRDVSLKGLSGTHALTFWCLDPEVLLGSQATVGAGSPGA